MKNFILVTVGLLALVSAQTTTPVTVSPFVFFDGFIRGLQANSEDISDCLTNYLAVWNFFAIAQTNLANTATDATNVIRAMENTIRAIEKGQDTNE